MRNLTLKSWLLSLGAATLVLAFTMAFTQAPGAPAQTPPAGGAPAAPGGGGGRGGGRGGGLPGATPEQTQAVTDMNTALAPRLAAAAAARTELGTVALADARNAGGIAAAVEKLRAAELALASARAEAFAQLQAGPNKLTPEQVAALIASGGNLTGGRGGPAPGRGRGN